MKLKYYLRGIGVGIIATTLILMIVFTLHKKDMISDAEIKARAAQLGMVMAEDLNVSDKLAQQDGSDAEDAEMDEPLIDTDDAAAEDMDGADAEDATQDPSGDAPHINVADDAEDEQKADTTTVEQVEFSIVGGEYSDAVCKKLFDAGLIEDEKDFNKYLAQGGYDSLIQPGTYVIPKGAEYKEIVSIITEKCSERKDKEAKRS